MDLLIGFCLLVIAFIFGRIYQTIKMINIISDLLPESEEEKVPSLTVFKLEIEEHQGVKYLYDSDAREFIGQGISLEELAKIFNERKKKSLGMLDYNNTNVYFIDGKVSDSIV